LISLDEQFFLECCQTIFPAEGKTEENDLTHPLSQIPGYATADTDTAARSTEGLGLYANRAAGIRRTEIWPNEIQRVEKEPFNVDLRTDILETLPHEYKCS